MPRPANTSPHSRAVLSELAARPAAWTYGYELCKRTGLKSGTVYPILIRFHEQGLVEAEWRLADPAGRPPRHAYRITAKGAALAASQAAQWKTATPLDPSPAGA